MEQLSPENCIGIWQFTNICPCFELQSKAYQLTLDHFEEVVSSKEFQDLAVRELTDIITRDNLSVSKESTVCKAIFHWIAHRPEEIQGHLLLLLSKVSFAISFSLDVADSKNMGAFKPVAPLQTN